jgi:hypothetical protein
MGYDNKAGDAVQCQKELVRCLQLTTGAFFEPNARVRRSRWTFANSNEHQ